MMSCNLRDNGFNVIVGQRAGKTFDKAVADGWVPGKTLFSIEEAAEKGTIVCMLLSDAAQIEQWPNIEKHLQKGNALYFSHGFGITYKERTHIVPSTDIDVFMVAPKGSGTSLRSLFLEGRGINSSYAIFQDATGKALDRTMAIGIGIGSGYMFETTFKRETYSDLTGERGALMGAVQGMFLAQYETLRSNGHTPSEAFNETVEEFTQSLLPMVGKNGMDWMYANCSTTAQRGALDWMGPFHDAIKPVMWGGTSTKGVDCSGFIRTTLLMHDIIIPRDASQQAYKGQHLDVAPDFSNLQPGDLLFFGTRATSERKEQVHHVGLYIGNRHFIHSIGWVHLSSFNPKDEDYDEYDLNRLLFASRILPYINKQEGLNTTDRNSFYK